ncbi:MAG: terpene cyclase/mutase family protein [Planctomyces sp.]|nr:terpene cyclase/mutase family protein [Planctomyces sp.]
MLRRSLILTVAAAAAFAAPLAVRGFDAATAPDTGEAEAPDVAVDSEAPAAEIVPPTAEEIQAAITRGIDFLIADQNDSGSWGSATQTKDLNIYAPIPGAHHGFRAATTALCVSTLIEADDQRPEVQAALRRGEDWLLEHLPTVRRATGDAIYNVWSHCYGLQALVRMHARAGEDEARKSSIRSLIEQQFDLLSRYESVDGGWGYYDFRYRTKQPSSDSISFVNAAVLVAFHEAKLAGFEPPQRVVDRAVAATLRQQLPDFSYLYGEYLKWRPRRAINRPAGSLGRTQACNLALRFWGDDKITEDLIEEWLDRLIARNGWLDIGRKRPIPHEAWFQVAGYFYYFGHYYAAYCIEELPEEKRPRHQAALARVILDKQEKDGSWWDFPLYAYHQPYGTSFAVMTLLRCR